MLGGYRCEGNGCPSLESPGPKLSSKEQSPHPHPKGVSPQAAPAWSGLSKGVRAELCRSPENSSANTPLSPRLGNGSKGIPLAGL